MSNVIDQRIVEMQFDNSRFESNVHTSISTLDKLKAALRLDGATKGLSTIEAYSNKFNLSSVGNAVETISSKFSALGIIGVTALQNITNKAVDAGTALVKSMSLDQITQGWSKYAEKTTAVQTIMAATAETWQNDADSIIRTNSMLDAGFPDARKAYEFASAYSSVEQGLLSAEAAAEKLGLTMDEYESTVDTFGQSLGSDMTYAGSQMDYVNEQMEKLNWFTDETSYNFVDMVGNIGKFTSNQIPLSQATTAMQGIATWAAISGQNAGAASRAMYNLSQAIGVGAVKLMDWRSIENANMATAAFKKEALESAVAVGKLTKESEGLYKTTDGLEVSIQNFSQTLSEGWFTSDVLLDTLDKYGKFTDELYKVSEASGLTATDLLELVEAEKKGTLTQAQINEMAAEGSISSAALAEQVHNLAGAEMDLGYQAFKAAQEAKTFQDAIDATKDAASTKWMNIFENIFGDYERARHTWTDFANFLYDTIVAPVEKIQELSEAFKAPLDAFSKGLTKAAAASTLTEAELLDLVKAERDGVLSQEQLAAAAEKAGVSMEELGDRVDSLASDSFGALTDELFSLSESSGIGADELLKLVKAQQDGTISAEMLAEAAEKGSISVEELTESVEELAAESSKSGLDRIVEGLKGIFNYLGGDRGILGSLREGFERVIEPMNITKETVSALIERFRQFGSELKLSGTQMSVLRQTGEILGSILLYVGNSLKNFWNISEGLRKSAKSLADSFTGFIQRLFTLRGGIDTTGAKGEIFEKVCQRIATAFDEIRKKLDSIKIDDFKNVIELIRPALEGIGNILKYIGNTIINVWDDIQPLLSAIGNLVTAVAEFGLKLLGSASDMDTAGYKSENFRLIVEKLSEWINKLAEGIRNLNLDELKSKFSGLSGVVEFLSGVFHNIVSVFTGGSFTGAFGKVVDWIKEKFNALKEYLSGIDLGAALKKGLGIGLLAGGFTGFIKLINSVTNPFKSFTKIGEKFGGILDNIGNAIKSFEGKIKAESLLKIAEAIALLAAALLILGFVNYDNAIIGVTMIAGILFGLYKAMKAIDGIDKAKMATLAGSMLIAAAAMLVLAIALAVLAGAVALFALVAKIDTIGEGLGIMTIVLAEVLVALEFMSKMSPKVFVAAAALLVMAVALIVLAGALAAFALVASMGDAAAYGLLYMTATLVVVAGVLAVLGKMFEENVGPLLAAAAALLVASVALLVLGAAFAAFALVASMESAGAGLGMLIITLAALTVALIALGETGPVVLAGAAALLVGAAACLVLAVAVGVVAVALPLLAIGLTMLGAAIGSALTDIGQGTQDFLVSISEAIIAIGDALAEIISSIGTGLGEAIAAVGTGIGEAITALIASVGEGIGQGITAISDAIGTFGENLTLAGTGIENFGNSVRSLEGIAWASTAVGIAELAGALKKLKPENLATTMSEAGTAVVTACTEMITAIQSTYSLVQTAGQDFLTYLVLGFMGRKGDAVSNAQDLANSAGAALQSAYGTWQASGIFLGQGFANGIWSQYGAVAAAAAALADAAASALQAAAQIHSPSKITTRFGQFWGAGFINGIASKISGVENVSEDMIEAAADSLASAESIIDSILQDDFTPVITPVLDLSNLGELPGSLSNLSIGAGVEKVQSISARQRVSSEIQNGTTVAPRNGDSYANTFNIYATPNQSVEDIANAVERRMVLKQKQRMVSSLG